MKKFLVAFVLLSFMCLAGAKDTTATAPTAAPVPPSGVVIKLRGIVLFEGQPVKEGDTISKPGKIETQDRSFLQIKIDKWKNNISIGPNSMMQLNFNDEKNTP